MKAEIKLGKSPNDASIVIDGKKLEYVKSLNIYVDANTTPQLNLKLIAEAVNLDLEDINVTVSDIQVISEAPEVVKRAMYECLKKEFGDDNG